MKVRTIFLFMSLILLTSCSHKENKYLKKLPILAKEYREKVLCKESQISMETDQNKTIELYQELEQLKNEQTKDIKRYIQGLAPTNPISFSPLPEQDYKITKVNITEITIKNIQLEFQVEIVNDIKDDFGNTDYLLSVYFVATDKEGLPIKKTATVAPKFSRDRLIKGNRYILRGIWGIDNYHLLENFTGIKQITKKEYEIYR